MRIRLESENDYIEVEELVRDSFWNVYRPGAYEHFFINYPEDDGKFLDEFLVKTERHARTIFDSVKLGDD